MRLIQGYFFAALVFASMLTTASAQGQVQQPSRELQRQAPGPALRSAAERAAAARRLGIIEAIAEYLLNSPFSLTPRRTYVPGRGYLWSSGGAEFDPEHHVGHDALGEGWITFFPAQGTIQPTHPFEVSNQARVHLYNASGKRFLVECHVSSQNTVRMSAGSLNAEIHAPSHQWLSIVTALGEEDVVIGVTPSNGVWSLEACEVTRIQ